MGIFGEDFEFYVSDVIKLWVSEGIIRPTEGKSLEEVAEECIKELIDRNLILVHKLRWNGEAKVCKMHDLLRDLCLREAKKQRFLRVLKHQGGVDVPECMNMERRISIHHHVRGEYSPEFCHALESASLTRSLILTWTSRLNLSSLDFRLLRVYSEVHKDCFGGYVDASFQNANLRCIVMVLHLGIHFEIPCSWLILWNLQTLKIKNRWSKIMAPSEIWELPLLRHVIIQKHILPAPVDNLILEDLQTLSRAANFKLTGDVIKKIINLKTLKLYYSMFTGKPECLDCSVNNLVHLKKLQSLNLDVDLIGWFDGQYKYHLLPSFSLPQSLKRLTLYGTSLSWEDCKTNIGPLPFLEFLRLDSSSFRGAEWETVEGQFCSLKFLRIGGCDMRFWRTDSTHFPRLEQLILREMTKLEEIPSTIGDIPTLRLIELENCSTAVEDSAKRINEEQVELGNEDLQVVIGYRTYYSLRDK